MTNDSLTRASLGAPPEEYNPRYWARILRTIELQMDNQASVGPLRSSTINISELPTSPDGLRTDDLWNDSGIVKIMSFADTTYYNDLTTTGQTTVYTAPTGKKAQLIAMNIANETGTADTITIEVTDDDAALTYSIWKTVSVAANVSVTFDTPIILEAADALKVTAGLGNVFHITTVIREGV